MPKTNKKDHLLILWDNDGVLVDTEPLYFEASRRALKEAGVTLTKKLFKKISLKKGESVFQLAEEKGLPTHAIQKLRLKRHKVYSALIKAKAKPRPGIRSCLQAVHGKAAMGIVTASLRHHFRLIHRKTKLLPFFDFFLTHEDVRFSKPHPEPFLKALQKRKVLRRNCLVIEDSERGLKAAKQAGLMCFVIPLPSFRSRFAGADGVFYRMRHLRRAVLSWIKSRSASDS